MKRICLSSSLRIVSLVLVCYSDGTKSLGLNRISSRLVLSEITDGNQGSKKSEIQTLQQSWTRLTALRGGGDRKLKIALCSWECLYTVAVGGVAPHVTELVAGLTRRLYRHHCEPSPQLDYRPHLKRSNCIFTYFLVQGTYRKKSKGHELMLFLTQGARSASFCAGGIVGKRLRDRRRGACPSGGSGIPVLLRSFRRGRQSRPLAQHLAPVRPKLSLSLTRPQRTCATAEQAGARARRAAADSCTRSACATCARRTLRSRRHRREVAAA